MLKRAEVCMPQLQREAIQCLAPKRASLHLPREDQVECRVRTIRRPQPASRSPRPALGRVMAYLRGDRFVVTWKAVYIPERANTGQVAMRCRFAVSR